MKKESQAKAYKEAGVDVNAGYEAVKQITPLVESTYIPGVIGSLGGFGGLFAPDLTGIEEPVLISGTDGVGTKLKLAFLLDKHDTVGIDCVAMCVNDIICSGASPLFFLDYISCGHNDPEVIAQIVKGISQGCKEAECALIGGETAEMPGFYPPDEYDMAGFSVGIVDKKKIIEPELVKEGDILIGLPSSGVHSNGFSLVRSIFDLDKDLEKQFESLGEKTLGEALIEPTVIYVPYIKELLKNGIQIHGISHITGGGFYENIPRMLPEGLEAVIQKDSYPIPEILKLIQSEGNLDETDMYHTFNMGIGMVLAIDKEDLNRVKEILDQMDMKAYKIGEVKKGTHGVVL